MESLGKLKFSALSRHELVFVCNEKLIYASRDLAEFTKHGIHARHIVELAYKCESLEKMLKRPLHLYEQLELKVLENELQEAVLNICNIGQKIWKGISPKYNDYVISHKKEAMEDIYPQPGMNVA